MYGYIYITVDTIKWQVYIGQHKSKFHDKNYFGSGIIIKNIIKHRNGTDSLKNYILEKCSSKDEMDFAEEKWIELFKKECGDRCINLAKSCHVDCSKNKGMKRTAEQRENISNGTKEGMRRTNAGKKISSFLKEYHKEHPNAFKGRRHRLETKEHWSEIRKGKQTYGDNPSAVKVINIESGKIFSCIKECAEFYGITSKVMGRWIKQHINNLYRLNDVKNN